MFATGDVKSIPQKSLFERHFTRDNWEIEDFGIKFVSRTAHIENLAGEVIFHQDNIMVPDFWPQIAVNILAQKYFRKVGVPSDIEIVPDEQISGDFFCRSIPAPHATFGGETDLREVAHRLAGHWVYTGIKNNYFVSPNECSIFYDEICYMIYMQIAAPNSPQFFNTGLYWAYGIKGNENNDHYAGDGHLDDAEREARCYRKGEVVKMSNSYEAPQIHACFINKVEDKLVGPDGIMDLWVKEARIFKYGSGSGCNYSAIRGKNEPLSGGGVSSGLLSFLKIGDAVGGAIKSGGTTRRAARMVILDDNHPDLLEFVQWKVKEEEKARALIEGSRIVNESEPEFPLFTSAFEGEAYATISGQNSNNSVNISTAFMEAVENERSWDLIDRTGTNINATTHRAGTLLDEIAKAAWKCGDPGIFFGDTINEWNTCFDDEQIIASNPCQPAEALLLTPEGIKHLGDLDVGATIWSADGWVKIERKWSTGVKAVYRYRTTAGEFLGTENHQIVQNGLKYPVKNARTIDVLSGPPAPITWECDKQAVMDGLFVGDGTIKLCNKGCNAYDLLIIGENDQDYFDYFEDTPELWPVAFDKMAYKVVTTITELPRTWERFIPAKYKFGNAQQTADFLKGLFSANGCVHPNYNRISLKTTSPMLRDDVQLMLSGLGIASYFTTNTPTQIKHHNGIYESKQSYDVNISRLEALEIFADCIGFIQVYKQQTLEHILEQDRAYSTKRQSALIKSADFVGEKEVFDITVSGPSHTYWTNGCNVSNCSEYLWFADTACNLASINLLQFYDNKTFDVEGFKQAVTLWTGVLDISVSMAGYPSPEVAKKSLEYRTLGLGYTNLGALLMVMGLPYDSTEARNVAGDITALMTGQAYATSARLADKLGAFPAHGRNKAQMKRVLNNHAAGVFDRRPSRWNSISKTAGRAWNEALNAPSYRNAQVTLLAPTGTISLLMDAQTTGVEPDFALVKYKELAGGGNIKFVNQAVERALTNLGYGGCLKEAIVNYILDHGTAKGCELLSPQNQAVFACANDIVPKGHLEMLAATQPFLSGGISKTINLPNFATVEDVKSVYLDAWHLGLKCVSVYRDGCKASQPLTAKKTPPKAVEPSGGAGLTDYFFDSSLKIPQQSVESGFAAIESRIFGADTPEDVKFHGAVTACATCGHPMSMQIGVCHMCPCCGATNGCS